MRKLCLLTAVLLLVSAWVVAQDSSQAAGAEASQTSSNAGETTTIEGCLSGSAGNYTLTDNSGKTYQLQGDSSNSAIRLDIRCESMEAKAEPWPARPRPQVQTHRPAPAVLGAIHRPPVLQVSHLIAPLTGLAVHQQRFSSM